MHIDCHSFEEKEDYLQQCFEKGSEYSKPSNC